MTRKLTRCLIANRGEIAVRLIRACREVGIQTVAVYSEVDATARHVQVADTAYLLGAAPPADSYLNIAKLIEAARRSGCDAVHPGYGFVSEQPEFAEAVLNAGLVWVGPPPDAIRLMGVKTAARALMEKAHVPVVPGFQSDGAGDDQFIAAARMIGYPVMVKAAGGGGGRGIRVVYDGEQLPEALAAARHEAEHAFGDPRLFLEKYIEAGRHIEIQVLADAHGNTVHLFERECSAQRRHQKVIEESPSPLLNDSQRTAMGQAAVEAARAVGYVNAGTVEFIVAPGGEFYFLEMNTRLQVEHPVTELVTGLDIVKLQLAIAAGDSLPFRQADLHQRGHAIECRIYAEDPYNQFLPAVGRVQTFIPPEGPGIRVDAGIQSGDTIALQYDALIAKLIVYDSSRPAALARMRSALQQTVILGTTTNIPFLKALLAHPTFTAGEVDTTFIERHLDELLPEPPAPSDAVLIAAAFGDSQFQPAAATSPLPAMSDGDQFTPWSRPDHFRIGGQQE